MRIIGHHPQLVLADHNGQASAVPLTTLLVFIDETGDERLRDPGAPIFGFGGLIVEAREYFNEVEWPWNTLKARFFDGAEAPLHASEIRDPSKKQLDALNEFFSTGLFGRFAVTVTDRTIIEVPDPVEYIVANALWDQIRKVANTMKWREISVIIEENRRLEPAIQRGLISKIPYNKDRRVDVAYAAHLKDPSFAGMEVADFIVHTAGRQARLMRDHHFDRDFSEQTPDFAKIFGSIPRLSSWLSISRASR